MPGKLLLLCLIAVLGSCAMMASEPPAEAPPGAVKADVGFPPPGTKWVARTMSQTGSSATITYTVLEDGTYEGKPVHRVSGGIDTLVIDKATGNMVATLRMGKEATATLPHAGTFSWPLYVGKSWTASYTYRDNVRGMSMGPIKVDYRVAAYEDVTIPAGTWKAFRIESESGGSSFSTSWYAPDIKLTVKMVSETTIGHSLGATKSVYEIIQYSAKDKASLKSETQPTPGTGPKAERPEWKVGYEWRFASKGPTGSGTFTSEVTREDSFEGVPVWVVKTGVNENFYTKDALGLLATMSRGKLISKRNTPYQTFSWPLEVRKEWRNSYVVERVEEKSSQTVDARMVVAMAEEIKVPAGTFEALKIEGYSSPTGKLFAEHWYSPKVKWFVKSKIYRTEGVREEDLVSFTTD